MGNNTVRNAALSPEANRSILSERDEEFEASRLQQSTRRVIRAGTFVMTVKFATEALGSEASSKRMFNSMKGLAEAR